MKSRTIWIWVGVFALAWLGFGFIAIRGAIDTWDAERSSASAYFEEIRAEFEDPSPLLVRGDDGEFTRVDRPGRPGEIREFHAAVFRPGPGQLVETEAPWWFVVMKGPAMQMVLRGTALDLDRLGITPRELEAAGPGIIVDDRPDQGNWVLVWCQE